MLTIKQIADRAQVSYFTAYEWVSTGKLPSVRINRVIRIREEDFQAFLSDHHTSRRIGFRVRDLERYLGDRTGGATVAALLLIVALCVILAGFVFAPGLTVLLLALITGVAFGCVLFPGGEG